VSNTTNNNGA